jgi:hypothetical protein
MKKRFKSKQIFLVMVISVFILALPAYLRCINLSEAKFLSTDLSFENPDQENGPPDNENGLKVFGPSAFFITFFLGAYLFEQPSHFFPQLFSLHHQAFRLRC